MSPEKQNIAWDTAPCKVWVVLVTEINSTSIVRSQVILDKCHQVTSFKASVRNTG